jgi:hypothetical protein
MSRNALRLLLGFFIAGLCTVVFQLRNCLWRVCARKYPKGFREFLKDGMQDRDLFGTIQIYYAEREHELRDIEVIAQGFPSDLDAFRMHLGDLTVSQLIIAYACISPPPSILSTFLMSIMITCASSAMTTASRMQPCCMCLPVCVPTLASIVWGADPRV